MYHKPFIISSSIPLFNSMLFAIKFAIEHVLLSQYPILSIIIIEIIIIKKILKKVIIIKRIKLIIVISV